MSMSSKTGAAHRPRILIVDDDPFATHLLGRLLRRHGYLAAEENDPTKAISIARRFHPDMVLLDVHMPWKDGYEVAEEFSFDGSLCGIPIVFITADAFEREKSTEAKPVLVKPFSLEELLATLKRAVSSGIDMTLDSKEADIFAGSGIA
jgi:CheY-like chemotaxis protein